MRHNSSLGLVMGLALCLILVTSQVGRVASYYPSNNGLRVGFYKGQCPDPTFDIEELIASKVKAAFALDPTLLPALLRMLFHDCFVHGCDASILIDGLTSEKKAKANLSVRGFELIESLKTAVEEQCPDVVSCADIIAIATKVVVKEGGGPNYLVPTGRRDGIVSNELDVNLPSPFVTVPESIKAFTAKNFTVEEMVVLIGCHTVGVIQCRFFQDRLYEGTSIYDPLMDPILRYKLMETCPKEPISNNVTLLNQSPKYNRKIDNAFYHQLRENRGVLRVDQELSRYPETKEYVLELSLNNYLFKVKLARALMKLQEVEVLTGDKGQIRKVCNKINY